MTKVKDEQLSNYLKEVYRSIYAPIDWVKEVEEWNELFGEKDEHTSTGRN